MSDIRSPWFSALAAVFLLLLFTACVETTKTQAAEGDPDALKTKVTEYVKSLLPQLQDPQVTAIEKSTDTPFYKAELSFNNRGRPQSTEIYITLDQKYLILGQVWDLQVDPLRARWDQRLEGAEERVAKADISDRPFKGNKDASVVVMEFSDYQCPYCSQAYKNLERQVMEEFGDQIKLVFKHLPLEQLHPWAKKASIAAVCAYVQKPEAFWDMHSRFFENQQEITVENLRDKVSAYASEIELEGDAFLACFDEEKTSSVVEADLSEAQQLGINSTPTFMINGALFPGAIPFDEMSAYIKFALEDAQDR